MVYAARAPAARLAPYVERLWALTDVVEHASERILPSGTFELVVNLDADEITVQREDGRAHEARSGAIVSGAYGRSFAIDARAHRAIVGVHFRPGGAAPFLGVSAIQLADAHVDLDAVWGADAGRLRDALCSAPTTEARFDLLEAALWRRLVQARERPVVRAAIASFARSANGIGAWIRASGISHRRFLDVFAAEVGMSPKRFARVSRFQRALARVRRGSAGWAEVALACGYVDQSHLIRDFRDFGRLTPGEYARGRKGALLENHVIAGVSIPSKTTERAAR